MTRRQCTQDYKLDPIAKEIRRLAGIKPRSPGPRQVVVEQLIGISVDEAHRQRDARFRWIRNEYPLVRRGITRAECLKKLAAWGWSAPKSACTFCPYHSDEMWLEMKRSDPRSFADAVCIDDALRTGLHIALRGEPYLHRSLRPLSGVDFDGIVTDRRARKQRQPDLFGNECEGMCGV